MWDGFTNSTKQTRKSNEKIRGQKLVALISWKRRRIVVV